MKAILMFIVITMGLAAGLAHAQGGTKANPKEIKFAEGVTSATVTGTLSSGKEANYFFKAQKGQKVTIRSPRWNMFDFRVYSEENFPDGDFDNSPSYTFEIPETGDYLFFVRKKMGAPRTARYSMTIIIKD